MSLRNRSILPERYVDCSSEAPTTTNSFLQSRNVSDHLKNLSDEKIAEQINKTAASCAVLMSHIRGDYNFANIIRTSNFLFGGARVFYYGKKHWDKRFAHGCYHYNKPTYLSTIEDVKQLKNKYRFICVEQTDRSVPVGSFSFPANSLFIMGEEQDGVSSDLLELADDFVEIPNRGSIRSLCVSSAFAVVSSHYSIQHKQ